MRKRPLISHMEASKRSKKAWETRHRKYPSHYGEILSKRGKSYWNRPNEMIRLKNFSAKEQQRIQPALAATDATLKPGTQLGLKHIRKARHMEKVGLAQYNTGSVVLGRRLSRPSIVLGRHVLKPYSRKNPAGLLAHEIGHDVFPGRVERLPRSRFSEYQRAFEYKQKHGKAADKIQDYKPTSHNPMKKERNTRQKENAAEDFAETYRAMTGLPVSNRGYWKNQNIVMNNQRLEHMYKHYIR